jgi:hypothetical protein
MSDRKLDVFDPITLEVYWKQRAALDAAADWHHNASCDLIPRAVVEARAAQD